MSVNATSLSIVVGVAGGIAAYKACHVVRGFTELGHDVTVVPTPAATKFVGVATFEALSHNPVSTEVFSAVDEVRHVRVGAEADLVVIAPATADLIARLASGRADDMLTATCLVATCPVVIAPAMHTQMWEHPATQDNVATLRRRGVVVLESAHGRLTGSDTGAGRLLDPEQIVSLALTVSRCGRLPRDMEGMSVVVSAGGTREHLDPVRFVGNCSSGKQGFALAEIAAHRGAAVTVVAGSTVSLPTPAGATIVRVGSARQMYDAMLERADADVIIMAAAVADLRPVEQAATKLKKDGGLDRLTTLKMVENPDILAELVARRRPDATTTIVGFAAETASDRQELLQLGRSKIARKGCDLLMVNDVAGDRVFGRDCNRGILIERDGGVTEVVDGSKMDVAMQIIDRIVAVRSESGA